MPNFKSFRCRTSNRPIKWLWEEEKKRTCRGIPLGYGNGQTGQGAGGGFGIWKENMEASYTLLFKIKSIILSVPVYVCCCMYSFVVSSMNISSFDLLTTQFIVQSIPSLRITDCID